jgi:hypothetical protein
MQQSTTNPMKTRKPRRWLLWDAIKTLEAAADITPRTDFVTFNETTDDERTAYVRWLRQQAPYSAIFINL